jgi:hypothetical protein
MTQTTTTTDHDYRREVNGAADRFRLSCSCGKRTRWSSLLVTQVAQDAHRVEVEGR